MLKKYIIRKKNLFQRLLNNTFPYVKLPAESEFQVSASEKKYSLEDFLTSDEC